MGDLIISFLFGAVCGVGIALVVGPAPSIQWQWSYWSAIYHVFVPQEMSGIPGSSCLLCADHEHASQHQPPEGFRETWARYGWRPPQEIPRAPEWAIPEESKGDA